MEFCVMYVTLISWLFSERNNFSKQNVYIWHFKPTQFGHNYQVLGSWMQYQVNGFWLKMPLSRHFTFWPPIFAHFWAYFFILFLKGIKRTENETSHIFYTPSLIYPEKLPRYINNTQRYVSLGIAEIVIKLF